MYIDIYLPPGGGRLIFLPGRLVGT